MRRSPLCDKRRYVNSIGMEFGAILRLGQITDQQNQCLAVAVRALTVVPYPCPCGSS